MKHKGGGFEVVVMVVVAVVVVKKERTGEGWVRMVVVGYVIASGGEEWEEW